MFKKFYKFLRLLPRQLSVSKSLLILTQCVNGADVLIKYLIIDILLAKLSMLSRSGFLIFLQIIQNERINYKIQTKPF